MKSATLHLLRMCVLTCNCQHWECFKNNCSQQHTIPAIHQCSCCDHKLYLV